MAKNKSKKNEDFKQVKIKVGKRLPKNTNVTRPNFKSGSIVLRPQLPLQDIENLDEAKRQTYKSYLKQLSHHNVKRQAEAANKLKSFINGDLSYKQLYDETIMELMKNYATVAWPTNNAMLELGSALFSKLNDDDQLKSQTKRIWLSLTIGITDILSIKQQTSVKMLFTFVDYFPIVILESIKSASFLLDLISLTENISFSKIELIKRIGLIFDSYLNKEAVEWNYPQDFNPTELDIINEFSNRFVSTLKDYICPTNDYVIHIGTGYQMISSQSRQEYLVQTVHMRVGLTALRNFYLFLKKFYGQCTQLVQSSSAHLAKCVETVFLSKTKHIFPIASFDATFTDQMNSINMSYCFVACDCFGRISVSSSLPIVSNMCNYLIYLFNSPLATKLKDQSPFFIEGLNVVKKLVTSFYAKVYSKVYGRELDTLVITLTNIDSKCEGMNSDNLQNLLQTIMVVIKNLDLSRVIRREEVLSNVMQCATRMLCKLNTPDLVYLLELLYYSVMRCPMDSTEFTSLKNLTITVSDKITDSNFFDLALNFLTSRDATLIVYFLKYCINHMFNCSTLTTTEIVDYTNSIVDILSTEGMDLTFLASFLYTCSVGFTLNETTKINEIISNNDYLQTKTQPVSLIPIEMILNDAYFGEQDKRTIVYQRALILMVAFQRIQPKIDVMVIYKDMIHHKVKQWLQSNPHCCHVNLPISLIHTNIWIRENFEFWSAEQVKLLINFMEEFSTATAFPFDAAYLSCLINSLRIVFLNSGSELPTAFIQILSNELANPEDLYLLENILQTLLLIYENHVFPTSLKTLLSQRIQGLDINSTLLDGVLDKII